MHTPGLFDGKVGAADGAEGDGAAGLRVDADWLGEVLGLWVGKPAAVLDVGVLWVACHVDEVDGVIVGDSDTGLEGVIGELEDLDGGGGGRPSGLNRGKDAEADGCGGKTEISLVGKHGASIFRETLPRSRSSSSEVS